MAKKGSETKESTSEAVIEINDAVVLLGDFPALSGVSLDVSKGEIIHLKGPNGAGKSTLLALMAGLHKLHSGIGVVNGVDLNNARGRRSLRKSVGFLSHELALYDELTVAENLEFWAKLSRCDLTVTEALLERVGLSGRLRQVKVKDLSAGQKRRTSLACVVVRRPTLWLLDEPYAGLDSQGHDIVDDLMRSAVKAGATVAFTSHDFSHANKLATRSVEIAGGQASDSIVMPGPAVGVGG